MIKFAGVTPSFACAVTDGSEHAPTRARWSDGHWSDICTRHMDIFRKNLLKYRASLNPVWFLRGRKSTKETIKP